MSRRDYTAAELAYRVPAKAPEPITRKVRHYAVKLHKDGVNVGLCLEFGPPRDPETGDELDRSWLWRAFRDGAPEPIENCVIEFDSDGEPVVKGEPVDELEYERLVQDRAWARKYTPNDPAANPRKAVDIAKMPPIKFPKREATTKGEPQ